jgi:hypothetical protein
MQRTNRKGRKKERITLFKTNKQTKWKKETERIRMETTRDGKERKENLSQDHMSLPFIGLWFTLVNPIFLLTF